MNRRAVTTIFLTLPVWLCFAATATAQLSKFAYPFRQLIPGRSSKQDVESKLGPPVTKVSETLYEYKNDTKDRYSSCGKIYVQYSENSSLVERVELLCQNVSCLDFMVGPAAVTVHSYPTPQATDVTGKGTEKERRLEYYGDPHYAVQTLIMNNGAPVSCRLGFYSPELYKAAVPKSP